jgi:hypothetical protein
MVWTDLQLGPRGSPRPDVYTINKSYINPRPTAYECKISAADFRSDVTSGKWSTYLEYAHSVIFAVPAGLISKDDVPTMCGLTVRHENAWRLAKKAVVNPRPIAQEALLKLLIDGVTREGPRVRAREWNKYDSTREFARKFGAEAARYVADAASVHNDLKQAEERRLKMYADAEKECARIRDEAMAEAPLEWRGLCNALDLDVSVSVWKVQSAIRELKEAKTGGKEAAALRHILRFFRSSISQYEDLTETKKEAITE